VVGDADCGDDRPNQAEHFVKGKSIKEIVRALKGKGSRLPTLRGVVTMG
jgi:hypothetical protein